MAFFYWPAMSNTTFSQLLSIFFLSLRTRHLHRGDAHCRDATQPHRAPMRNAQRWRENAAIKHPHPQTKSNIDTLPPQQQRAVWRSSLTRLPHTTRYVTVAAAHTSATRAMPSTRRTPRAHTSVGDGSTSETHRTLKRCASHSGEPHAAPIARIVPHQRPHKQQSTVGRITSEHLTGVMREPT
jgi:hypothetical protein